MKVSNLSLVARPSHVFQRTREKSGRPGLFGDVMMYMPPLHHQIDQAFPIFLVCIGSCIEKHGKPWLQG